LKIFLIILPLVLLLGCSSKKTAQTSLPIQEVTLSNGLHLIMIKNTKAPATGVYHWVKAGSLQETKGSTGIAHLFEHMMFRPLKKGAPSFDEKLKPYGVRNNASTKFESTVYTTVTPQEYLEPVLKIEAERFQGLQVDETLLKVEKEAVRSEYSTKMDANPIIDLWETIYRKGYKDHPYEWMIIGAREDLDKITAAQANAFFKKFYRPNNTGLVISGDIDFAETLKWVKQYYGSWKKQRIDHPIPPVKMSPGFIQAQGNLSANSRNVLIGHRIPEFTPSNYMLMELANFIVYSSSYSVAYRQLVTEKKLASDAGPFNFRYDNGMIKGFFQLLPSTSLKSVINEVNHFSEIVEAMSDEEFKAYSDKFRLNQAESLQRNNALVSLTAMSWGKYGDTKAFRPPIEISVTKEDVVKFMKTYFVKDNMVVITNKNFKGVK